MRLIGAVLTGGASRRMGSDKALVLVEGTALARRIADTLQTAGVDDVVAIGGDPVALGAIGLTVVPDLYPGDGPLGALLTALDAARDRGADGVVAMACDLCDLDTATVDALVDVSSSSDAQVVAATADRLQPLCAVWRVSAAPAISDTFRAGERSVFRAIDALEVVAVPVARRAVMNANTVDDLRSRVASQPMAVQEVTIDQLEEALAAGARLIDVRNPDEYVEARVPGAVLIPLSTLPDNVEEFRSETPTYVICKAGGRSMSACAYLADRGIATINVAGGTAAWVDSGRPYLTGNDPA